MPKSGDSFTVILKEAHLSWGEYRHTSTRNQIQGEAYIPIPKDKAIKFGIYNSNYGHEGLGYNVFDCTDKTGTFLCQLKAAGCSNAGDIYAKQFQGNGSLQLLGNWFSSWNAKPGDWVNVEWISPTNILLTHK